MRYDAVVFDMDGVLVELTDVALLQEAAYAAFEACGVPDPPVEHVEAVTVGVDPDELAAVCAVHDLDGERFWRYRDARAARAQVRAALDGRKAPFADVAALDALDVPLGVVSTNQQGTVDFLLRHHGLADAFDTAYGRSPALADVRRKKPDPHFLERACSDLGVAADRMLFVGDSPSDVAAATNVGADAAFLERDGRDAVDLPATPRYEWESLAALRTLG